MRGHIAAIVLIVLGSFFLARNLGLIDLSVMQIIKTWWPALLIVLGVVMFVAPRERVGSDAKKKDPQ